MSFKQLVRALPAAAWLPGYRRDQAAADLVAAVIVTIMLIPQSLAYAMLAGLPPEVGLYASILPLVAYALFGSSRTLAVGPVAVVSLLTATAVSRVAEPGSAEYIGAALVLAALSGALLFAMGALRLGWIANLLSHPVVSGFITASGILIAASQLKHVLGIDLQGHNLPALLGSLARQLDAINPETVMLGVAAIAFLFWVRSRLRPLLARTGLPPFAVEVITKAGPVVAVVVTTLAVAGFGLNDAGVRIVGAVPGGLPTVSLPPFSPALWLELAPAAAIISLIGFVESVSVAQTLAAKRRQRVDPNKELLGLGAANIAAAFSGGYPVTGGFSRSVVNFDAGARTPLAGVFTAIGIALTTLLLTPAFHYLPKATLAATIIVAVLSLVDIGALRRVWRYSRCDFAAMATTIVVVLAIGVETGVLAGIGVSIALFLWRTARPHVAVLGRVPGTEHFRNVERHEVITSASVLSVRVDESLYFANIRFLEDYIYDRVVTAPGVTDVVLLCSAINQIDASALEGLEALNRRLSDAGVRLHLSEVKGPVMDALERTDFLAHLTGEVFLTHFEALARLDPEATPQTAAPNPVPIDNERARR
ncbi:SulP family inorganic anion transporter [Arhodomonas sp. AD133]|uniref:SulP family inorganic anion transporter n=1 Tax=Arhodomonas sp. AD133 TaxID=3415009 RepID=UPI003EB89A82